MADFTNDPQSVAQAKINFAAVSKEISLLEPSSIVILYEIDVTDILENFKLDINFGMVPSILRFHNMQPFRGRSILFGAGTEAGNANIYYSIPIMTEGFETSAQGDVPRPLLTLASIPAINEAHKEYPAATPFSNLKTAILQLNNLINAKVTRIRTHFKFLHHSNVEESSFPEDFDGWNNAIRRPPELSREIYYVQRKTIEDKETIQFELSSVIDIESFKLPGRLCLASRCPFFYRGEGCCYEYKAASGSADETEQKDTFEQDAQARMPTSAPAIATEADILMVDEVPELVFPSFTLPGYVITNTPSAYDKTSTYERGQVVFIKKDGIKYYFVSKGGDDANVGPSPGFHVPAGALPPDSTYWVSDRCSKSIDGCKLRWASSGGASWSGTDHAKFAEGFLRFGGFPSLGTKQNNKNV